MGRILTQDSSCRAQIFAGQNVPDVLSIIKELVENSIDADAKKISNLYTILIVIQIY